ncbi:uncharacterized protein LOC122502635 [Leptopilina heterotoma]|uniref:uncharacterized protein LOC122502635 n=1 Tax=Leptopilina heterotoma TaxID=63436 RepID=UPI001CA9F585|nr:uncharacterized protein LOC122502635 [Leptopilina heterotoma]
MIVIILSKVNSKKLKVCMQELNSVEEKMRRLEMAENYFKPFWMSVISAVFFIVYLLVLYVILFAKCVEIVNSVSIFITIATFYFLLGTPYVIECKFFHIISFIKNEFYKVNEALRQLSETEFYSPQKTKLSIMQLGLICTAKRNLDSERKLLDILQQIHLDLVKISRSVNDMFRIEILTSVGLSVIFLIFIYITVVFSILKLKTSMLSLTIILSIYYLTKILAINHICHTTSAEASMTEKVLFELSNIQADEGCFNKIEQFLFTVTNNRLQFTANGFFHLNHNCIQYIVGIMTPYIITTQYVKINKG